MTNIGPAYISTEVLYTIDDSFLIVEDQIKKVFYKYQACSTTEKSLMTIVEKQYFISTCIIKPTGD